MKKVFCFSLIVMFLALAGLTPVRADDISVVTPFVDTPTLTQAEIEQYTYSTMLMEYLRCGGTIDVRNKSDNYTAYNLIDDFGNFVEDVIGVVSDVINPFQSEFQWGKGYPLSKATPATLQLMGLLPFYAVSDNSSNEPDIPTPLPDPNYISYLERINKRDNTNQIYFWFYDFPLEWREGNTLYTLNYFPIANYTWVTNSSNYPTNSNSVEMISNNVSPIDIKDLYIFSNESGNYSFIDSGTCYSGVVTRSDVLYLDFTATSFNKTSNGDRWFGASGHNIPPYTYSYSLSNTNLSNILNYISLHYKNVNIYVDNVCWAYVGSSSTPTNYSIELSTSTVTPTGERVRWMYDNEIYVDVDKIIDMLNDILDAIDNIPNTPTVIKFDDLQDVIVDVDGQPAVAVKVLGDTRNIDQIYLDTYGPIIPGFLPMFTPVIDDVDIITIADTAVSPIPDDLLEVFGYMFMGVLFVGFIHRLLE